MQTKRAFFFKKTHYQRFTAYFFALLRLRGGEQYCKGTDLWASLCCLSSFPLFFGIKNRRKLAFQVQRKLNEAAGGKCSK